MLGRLSFSALCLVSVTACAGEEPVVEDLTVGEPVAEAEGGVEESPEEPALPEECDAEEYRGLIGTPFAEATFPEDPMIRVYGVNDIITQDYRPQRTNVIYDVDGTIVRVTCG